MRQILKSYLKLFVTSWLETIGTLLFLITFIIVILSMLPAPLQISLMAYQTNKKTNQWDYTVQLDANKVAGSNMMNDEVYDFSSEFLEKIAINFLEGKVVARELTTIEEVIALKDDKSLTLTSLSGNNKYVVFESITDANKKEDNPVEVSKFPNSLFEEWFKKANEAAAKIIKIENPINEVIETIDKTNKYAADLFIYGASMLQNWKYSESIAGDYNDSDSGVKQKYINFISDILGYQFKFDNTWTSDPSQNPNEDNSKNDAYNDFLNAFKKNDIENKDDEQDMTLVSNFFKSSVLDYYYLENNIDNKNDKDDAPSRFRDIWASIQTNVYDQLKAQGLGLEYTRENTLYTNAKIGDNKLQAVNFTEILGEDEEKSRINNLVFSGNYATPTENISEMTVIGNDKFLDSIDDYGNKFKVNGEEVKIIPTSVGYKLNGITAKNSSYNYSMFTSKASLTGELYIRKETFKKLFDVFAEKRDNEIPIDEAQDKSPLEMKSIFYLSLSDNKEEAMSYLFGDVSNTHQNIFAIDTGNIYSKDDSPQLRMITMVNLMTIIYSVIGLVLLALASIFMLYSQKEELNRTRKQLGVFKSNGYRTWQLSMPSTIKVFILMFTGLLLGYLFSFPLQMSAVDKQFGAIGVFSIARIYANPLFLFILLGLIPLVFTGIIFLILFKFLSEKPLDLMKPVSKPTYVRYPIWYWFTLPLIFPFVLIHKLSTLVWKKTRYSFTFKLQAAFLSMSKGKFTIVMILFAFATYLVSMEMKAMPVMNNMFNEGTAYLDDDTDHESYLSGDGLTIADEGEPFAGKYTQNKDSFVGRKFIDLDGRTVDEFLKKQKSLDINDDKRVMDDFVFDVETVIGEIFNDRIALLNWIDNNIKDEYGKLKDILMESTSLFAIGALVVPLDTMDGVIKLQEMLKKVFNDIKNILEMQSLSQDQKKEKIKEVLYKFRTDIKAMIDEQIQCGNENEEECLKHESLLTTKLSNTFDQIDKVKAVKTNDIFKITWMLVSGWLGHQYIDVAKLESVSEIKSTIKKMLSNEPNKSFTAKDESELPIEDIKEAIERIIEEIIVFFTNDKNIETIGNVISASNFMQNLLQPLLLTEDGVDPLITNNSIIFDSRRETLISHEEIRIKDHNYYSTLMSFDSTGEFGDLRNQYKFDGIWNWGSLRNPPNEKGEINVIITKPIAKLKNVSIGDKIEIYNRNSSSEENAVVGNIIGIQSSNIVVNTVYVDYNAYFQARAGTGSELDNNKYTYTLDENEDPSIEQRSYVYENVYVFDKVISSKIKVNLPIDEIGFDLSKLGDSFSFAQDSFSYMTQVNNQRDVRWFTSMIAGSSYLSNIISKNSSNDDSLEKAISSGSYFVNVPTMSDAMSSYVILKAGGAVMIDMITNMMIVNIVISLVLLLILFTVLIKIIIHDAQGIIILMRSIGYKDVQINWIVMGKYLTYSIAAFVIMYFLSYLTWIFIADLSFNKYGILLAIPFMWWLPLAIFAAMESVIIIGFLFGVYRLKKLPLARL